MHARSAFYQPNYAPSWGLFHGDAFPLLGPHHTCFVPPPSPWDLTGALQTLSQVTHKCPSSSFPLSSQLPLFQTPLWNYYPVRRVEEIGSGSHRIASLRPNFPVSKALGESLTRPGLSHTTAVLQWEPHPREELRVVVPLTLTLRRPSQAGV